jgi:hypothetical protein
VDSFNKKTDQQKKQPKRTNMEWSFKCKNVNLYPHVGEDMI